MKTIASLVLLFLISTATAFLASSFNGNSIATTTTPTSESRLSMACRFNIKKEKIKRNRDKMNKYKKRGTSRKSIVRGQRQQAAQEREADFMATIFQYSKAEEPATES
mmetsp:Transcript_9119/g.13670  ORF Transcript_9119/g.13670 Transcript_9119/m.13670 type:complete len:108 (+) Transcript_9119:34-357(+)